MDSLAVQLAPPDDQTPNGYGDGVDPGGERYLYRKQTVGTNFALKQPYTFSRAPSGFQSSAPATNTTILTDGVVGSPVTGSFAYWLGQCWSSGANVDLRVDLGQLRTTGAFRAHLFGSPGWDALKGQVLDRIEVLTSTDGVAYTSRGLLGTSLWKKDIPINYMLPDDEKATAWNFELVLPVPVEARYVTYHITPKRILCASELQVLDRIGYDPFDIRIAPPSPFTAPPIEPVNASPSVTLTSPGAGGHVRGPCDRGGHGGGAGRRRHDSAGRVFLRIELDRRRDLEPVHRHDVECSVGAVRAHLRGPPTTPGRRRHRSRWSSPSRRWAMSPSPPLSV